MSNNPWNDSNALEAFWTEQIIVPIVGGTKTIACCVFPIDDIDPFDDNANGSDIKRLNILIDVGEWETKMGDEPKNGTSVTFESKSFKVSKVENENGLFKLEVRSV